MRRLLIVLALAATGCLYETRPDEPEPAPEAYAPPPPPADAPADYSSYDSPPPPAGSEIANDDVFYQDLAPYGSWTVVAPYGRVWIPAVAYGWRPYYYGHWVLTDWGWTFASDDPWGWAAYHYGRWNWGVGVGWYWIPGHVWGPAWVTWRWGGGYAAWCPMGPTGVVFGYHHPAWVAVQEQHFTQPIRRVAVPVSHTASVVTSARPLSGPYATARSGSFGPPISDVHRAVGQPIARVRARDVNPRPPATAAPAPRPRPYGGSPSPGGGVTPRPAPRPYTGAAPGQQPHGYGGGSAPHPSGSYPSGSHPSSPGHTPAPQSAPAPSSSSHPSGASHPHAGDKAK